MTGPIITRQDWTLFRSLDTLCQKAGVARGRLAALLIKELVDNALDAAGAARFGVLEDGAGFWVEDDGPGFAGGAERLAELFSLRRPLMTSKVWRLPSRGALGNGLRVIVGAVTATKGRIVVRSGGRRVVLIPGDDGRSRVESAELAEELGGARVTVELGEGALKIRGEDFAWAERAVDLARGPDYKGKSSPRWYSSDAFFELCQTRGQEGIRSLVRGLDGGSRRGPAICDGFARGRKAGTLNRNEAALILARARQGSRLISPKRLGMIGFDEELGDCHALAEGVVSLPPSQGRIAAEIPYLVEVWAADAPRSRPPVLALAINKSPSPHAPAVFRDDARVRISGCEIEKDRRIPGLASLGFSLLINIQAPYLPRTSDGKSPDLSPFAHAIGRAVFQALRALARRRDERPTPGKHSVKTLVLANLPHAIERSSGGGRFRFSLRHLYYVIRPIIRDALGSPLSYKYFSTLISDHEARRGEIPGLYRDPRGFLYHPHIGELIPLGTREIERYQRPRWTFNKILFLEKKSLLTVLTAIQWPERYDCAVVAAEGQATRAIKDLFDLLGESEEDLTFFCVHDADAYGTMIYEGLQAATRARGARKVEVINLGLDPWEAVEMGLEWERCDPARKAPVARYVTDPRWRQWLQARRIELNAMTPGQFVGWLNCKLAEHDQRLLPPSKVLEKELEERAREALRAVLEPVAAREIGLEEALDEKIAPALARLKAALASGGSVEERTRAALKGQPGAGWQSLLEGWARELAEESLEDGTSGA